MPTAIEPRTSINIRRETWRRLLALRTNPSDTWDRIIARLLDERREAETPQNNAS